MSQTYQPPRVWKDEKPNEGHWASINSETSGARHEAQLKKGDHKLQLYSLGTPNGQKVTILLEELLELGINDADYDAWLVHIGEGEQFSSGFVEINPNSKIPALVDASCQPPVSVFESGHILLYLAEKFGHFLPTDGPKRAATLNWLFWLQGAAPFMGGGFNYFYVYSEEKYEVPINRYTRETKRFYHVLDVQLGKSRFIAGDEYTIADMNAWPWFNKGVLDPESQVSVFLDLAKYKNVLRWAKEIAGRPAVKRGFVVNNIKDENGLTERHSKADFDRLNLS